MEVLKVIRYLNSVLTYICCRSSECHRCCTFAHIVFVY